MTKLIVAAAILLALSAWSPNYMCHSYGFSEGSTAFSQCLQNETLANRRIAR